MPGMPGRTSGRTPGAKTEEGESPFIEVQRFNFVVEFCWQPEPAAGETSPAASSQPQPAQPQPPQPSGATP
jgi:hypothetical protein